MEVNPLKTVCGYACGGIINLFLKNSHTCNPLTPWNTFVNAYLHTGWPPSVQLVGMLQHNVTDKGGGGGIINNWPQAPLEWSCLNPQLDGSSQPTAKRQYNTTLCIRTTINTPPHPKIPHRSLVPHHLLVTAHKNGFFSFSYCLH